MQAREQLDTDGLHVVELSGEVDLHHSVELREILNRHAEEQRKALLVDLTEVTYIDSAGLATLIEYVQRMLAFGGKMALGGLSARVRTVFELARLDQVFSLYPTRAEAKAVLSS